MTLRKPLALLVLSLCAACASEVTGGDDPTPSSSSSSSSSSSGSSGSCTPQCTVGDNQSLGCCVGLSYCQPNEGTGGSGGGSSSSATGTGGGCTPGCEAEQTQTCQLVDGCPAWVDDMYSCDTPLVAVFDGKPVELVADSSHGFTLNARGSSITDWPTARTPWLALDRDGNGAIDDGGELFGSMTALPNGRLATNGFEALRALDTDGDGLITQRDLGFAKLALWADRDGDRATSAGELTALGEAGIVSIDLRYTSEPRCDARGNCEVERAPFTYRDASGALRSGEIVDVHLRAQR
jgi:hypothetical protein